MLPLAFSLGVLINAFVLWEFFRRDFAIPTKMIAVTFRHSFSASVVMGFSAYLALQVLAPLLNLNTFFGIFSQGFLAGIVGIGVGVILLFLMGNGELSEVSASFHKKFWEKKHLVPDQDEL
jgi:hypothetical protein